MTYFSDDTLSAYVDGMADEAAMAAIERALETDAALAARIAALQANDRLLQAAIDEALGPTPADLVARLQSSEPASKVIPLRRRPATAVRIRDWAVPAAAALLVGIVSTVAIRPAAPDAFMLQGPAGPVVGPRLAVALSQARSGEPRKVDGAVVDVSLSFATRDGRYCRQFSATFAGASGAGVACRQAGGWRVEDWTSGAAARTEGYQSAGGPDNPEIDAALTRLGVARTLDRIGEADEIALNWATAPAH